MVYFIFNLINAIYGEGRFGADFIEFSICQPALSMPVFTCGYFDVAPDFELALE